jgi:type III pantothenate kinase
MASQTPVVATRVGGMVDVVEEGVSGLLVEPDDVGELAAAIRSLLDDPERRRRMGRAARARVEGMFRWSVVVASLRDTYAKLLPEPSSSAAGAGCREGAS